MESSGLFFPLFRCLYLSRWIWKGFSDLISKPIKGYILKLFDEKNFLPSKPKRLLKGFFLVFKICKKWIGFILGQQLKKDLFDLFLSKTQRWLIFFVINYKNLNAKPRCKQLFKKKTLDQKSELYVERSPN